ncbi:MAG: beta-lactamase family protein [Deltaproteobacteria bacterium]|nr:beta-lactamase family protein [Deltaproteobacteria bacterium]
MTDAHTMMQAAVRDGVFPAAELLIAREGTIAHHGRYGAATAQTIFDVASLTKVIVTTTRMMQLAAAGRLQLDDTAARHLPELAESPYGAVPLRRFLSHTAGFPAWQPYFRGVPERKLGTPDGYALILQNIMHEPPAYSPGTACVYSDLGFILLGALLERVDGRGLEQQCATEIAAPLGLNDTRFLPLAASGRAAPGCIAPLRYAPTEDCPWRKSVLRGAVHDQNCYAMGGVAGHAGLFSTAHDLHRFAAVLTTCWRGTNDWIASATVHAFFDFDRLTTPPHGTYLCGWDTPSPTNSQAGRHFSRHSIGHLGYTGCSLWIDLERDWWVILLTNRVHPSVTNEKIKAFRPQLHDAAYATLFAAGNTGHPHS